ncbi:MAG: GtrA family protein [Peptococcaceae bacterium]|nr:GtrA family protein [Peptococcaceae bacterium]
MAFVIIGLSLEAVIDRYGVKHGSRKWKVTELTNKYPWLVQFGKYVVIGGGTAAVELALFAILSSVIPISPANVIAVTLATVGNFLLNGRWAFRQARNLWRSAVLYLILFGLNLLFSTLTIYFLVEVFGVSKVLAKLGTMACIVCWNFVLYRKVVFV